MFSKYNIVFEYMKKLVASSHIEAINNNPSFLFVKENERYLQKKTP
ncbi:hypothetical protein [Mesobacillus boroniphilus]|nr:hypothetical protein [Mesobacillus boroniphilus]